MNALARKLLITVVALGVAGMLAGAGTYSALSATTQNDNNSFAAGSVSLTDNDGGTSKLFQVTGLKPADGTKSGCIAVTYNGSLAAAVRLYGSATGTGLDKYLNLTITRGTQSDGAFGCSSFTADSTNPVLYSGTLKGFNDAYTSFAQGLADTNTSWSGPETHAYKFDVSLQNDAGGQGLNATQTFTWEAQSK